VQLTKLKSNQIYSNITPFRSGTSASTSTQLIEKIIFEIIEKSRKKRIKE